MEEQRWYSRRDMWWEFIKGMFWGFLVGLLTAAVLTFPPR